ncbi:uncharacterized protein PADG_07578 [Paracoccidioides brasiliensis Pb18]|uniref:DUF7730 domain-containing protein n=1 Tax=Paracoccidioides brasiliensis (strain Pb18) TaxID=502780 RepID=C1GJZ2_PARBD|nr:uncharacterized protein PADG_07578 [Paracoccidioides brasiliensis Pb18]EEH42758.2 hypothetical protein PADG_07578 [Paracoccidioides brasiliensis Pb18]ODH46138.1 hypothetical protein GX48_07773 [Paracoccidioides brasiliensis]
MLNLLKSLLGFAKKTPAPAPGPQRERECYFLTRLPPEIRIQIYNCLFDHDTIHLLHNKDQISHIRTPERGRTRFMYAPYSVRKPEISSILLTCRQIHREAAPLFYSRPIFRVSLQETWNVFAKLIGPENLSNVRSLQAPANLQVQNLAGPSSSSVHGQPRAGSTAWTSASAGCGYKDDERKVYDEFCEVLTSKMRGLKDLMLVLVSLPEGLSRSLEAEWHAPFQRMRGLQMFALEIRNERDAEAEDTRELVRFLKETVCAPRDDHC